MAFKTKTKVPKVKGIKNKTSMFKLGGKGKFASKEKPGTKGSIRKTPKSAKFGKSKSKASFPFQTQKSAGASMPKTHADRELAKMMRGAK